jgi:DNA-binding transcriptional LysR family regulator
VSVFTDDISFEELQIFSLLYRVHSVREAARLRHQSPSHISKSLKSLEGKLQINLFIRTQRDITPTIEATRFAETAKNLIDRLTLGIQDIQSPAADTGRKVISIGTISFLASHLVPRIIPALSKVAPDHDLRIVEFTHNQLIAHGIQGAFGAAVHIGELDWPKSWVTVPLGHLRWSLFAGTGFHMPRMVSKAQVKKLKFVVPIDWRGGDCVQGSDFCPLPVHQRLKGHEVFTAETAIKVASFSTHVTYVPDIIAERALKLRQVQRVEVEGWPDVWQDIHLTVHRDAMSNKQMDQLHHAFSKLVGAKEERV